MQATVEELNTTNDDLESRTFELQALAIQGDTDRNKLRTIVDGVEYGVVVVDADGSIVLENASYTALIADHENGATMVDETGKRIAKRLTPVERATRGEQFEMTFAYDRSGSRSWYLARGKPVDTDRGDRLGVVAIRETASPT